MIHFGGLANENCDIHTYSGGTNMKHLNICLLKPAWRSRPFYVPLPENKRVWSV